MAKACKPPNKNDLRWRRTERHLLESFEHMLAKSPLEKLKVTELCRMAEISKATFYLHYRDIYDLADAYVDMQAEKVVAALGDPLLPFYDIPLFVRTFINTMRSDEQMAFWETAEKNHLAPRFMERLLKTLTNELDSRVEAPDGPNSRIGLAFTIFGLAGAEMAGRDMPDEELAEYLTKLMSESMNQRRESEQNGKA